MSRREKLRIWFKWELPRIARSIPRRVAHTIYDYTIFVIGFLMFLGVIMLPGAALYLYGAEGAAAGDAIDESTLEADIVEEINTERADWGFENLSRDHDAHWVARDHSMDMVVNQFFSHTSSNGDRLNDRLAERSTSCYGSIGPDGEPQFVAAETLAVGMTGRVQKSVGGDVVEVVDEEDMAEFIVNEWLDSKHHRDILLSHDWDTIGVGAVAHDNGTEKVTVVVCRGDGSSSNESALTSPNVGADVAQTVNFPVV